MSVQKLIRRVPKKTKFWTFKDSFVDANARMCTRCGNISWFGDLGKLAKLRLKSRQTEVANDEASSEQK